VGPQAGREILKDGPKALSMRIADIMNYIALSFA